MDNNIQQFIDSGILEAFVMGAATKAEEQEVLHMKQHYSVVQQALTQIEHDLETMAQHMAIQPPADLWSRVEAELKEVIPAPEPGPIAYRQNQHDYQQRTYKKEPDYLEVEAQSSHMRVHKTWKWVFAAVFILGKIFLACAIYFYLENRQAQQNVQELKQEVQQLKIRSGR
ncbi:hypothetical protein HH214_16755 [Mucilaginibacter robiniae]|uniref:Uncharacterized protein n=1 Tax=Mucilaginibacter robiniae TaxID=2728022 RepID=A0A7L5E308_9SPHI|nr:hypothetical protein [Mucilaginibacter robiniae]QJD97401.1 hypothetical protein HH214_16755 [Mucilaginibacter robiniae]